MLFRLPCAALQQRAQREVSTVIIFAALVAACVANPAAAARVAPADAVTRANAASGGVWRATPGGGLGSAHVFRLGATAPPGVQSHSRPPPAADGASAASLRESLPASFDSREAWHGCVGPVLDQGDCGSCWAVSTSSALSDRLCISERASTERRGGAPAGDDATTDGMGRRAAPASRTELSAAQLASCDRAPWHPLSGNKGCEGGDPGAAIDYAADVGLVSAECAPYLEADGGKYSTCPRESEPCLEPFQPTPSCPGSALVRRCADGARWPPVEARARPNGTRIVQFEDHMAAELVARGPFVVTIEVYDDFVHYSSGVYTQTSDTFVGLHAIKLVGYGVTDNSTGNGTEYWLLQNSWTDAWVRGRVND